MDKKNIELTEEQEIIVRLSEGQHLVLAPPGTGKTELLSQRVDQALLKGISADKMICLTFTNRAAKNMKERIEVKHPHNAVFIGNIHQYCSAFLFQNKLLSQFHSLIDEDDAELLMEEAKSTLNNQDKNYIGDFLRLNPYLKQLKYEFPESILMLPPNGIQNNLQAIAVCAEYEKLKQESCLYDFDDLLTYTYLHLLKSEHYCLTNFEWLQVDEVQDLNPMQWGILSLISTANSHRVYFGDYEQAIFSFMGARLESIHKISKECDKVYNLQRNFRSPSYLINIQVDYAKALLNPTWKKDPIPEKVIEPQNGDLQLIKVNGTNITEANNTANKILPKLLSENDGQTAILVKWNSTANLYSKVLTENKIDHFKVSGFDLFSRKLIKDIIAFLSCLDNDFDRLSWFRLFNIFGKIPTLKESRHFVNAIYAAGFFPSDFIDFQPLGMTRLHQFVEDFKNRRFVVFDTETTGLDTNVDDIIQIAAIEMNNGQKGRTFEVYLSTDKSLDGTQAIHKITKEVLDQKGLKRKEAFASFISFVDDAILVAHNLEFDLTTLKHNLVRDGMEIAAEPKKTYDTLELARRFFPTLSSFKLENILAELEIEGENTHNALDDVKATSNILNRLFNKALELENGQIIFIEKNQSVLERFNQNLFPLWQPLVSSASVEVNFSEVINEFLSFIETNVSYKIEDDDRIQLNKLLKHMETCGRMKLNMLLKIHMPNYRHYKEADLITGTEKVIISTVYKAKGSEFTNVIIPECVTSVYPSFASETEEKMREDARSLYVALSRAQKRLILTTHNLSINQYGRQFPKTQSPFLQCIEKHFSSSNIWLR